jgi:hypothetical protein
MMDFFFSDSANKKLLAPKTTTLNEKQKERVPLKFSKNQISQKTTQEEKESRKRVNIINLVVVILKEFEIAFEGSSKSSALFHCVFVRVF